MNILIAYATNSGSTYETAQQISQTLQDHGHQVNISLIRDIHDPQLLTQSELTIIGSPSWEFEKKEGHPHDEWMDFIRAHPEADYHGHHFVVYGLGDKSYEYFTGAVDHLTRYIEEHHGHIRVQPLRINRYFFDIPTAQAHITDYLNTTLLPSLPIT